MAHTLEQKIRTSGFKNGLVLGLITTTLSILSYYVIISLSKSALLFIFAPIVFKAFIPLLAVILLCFNIRKNIGGLWTFKQATAGIFIMLIIAYAVNLVGKDLIFDKVIEPDSVQKTQVAAIKTKTANMKEKGVSQAKIDASIAEMKKDFMQKDTFSIGNFITGNAFIILFLFVFALIFASLMRNAEYVSVSQKK
jgi:hypothetical protein